MVKTTKTYTQEQLDQAEISFKVANIEKMVIDIHHKLDANYVTKDELRIHILKMEQIQKQTDFIQKIVFGVIGTIALTVVGAILNLVVHR